MQRKMRWSCSVADSPGGTFSMSCHLTCAEHPRSLAGSTEKKPLHVHTLNVAVKDGANCQ